MCLVKCGERLVAEEDIVCYKWLEVKSSITYNPDLHDKEFIGNIQGIICSGKIVIYNDCTFFCTNNPELDGCECDDRLDYLYSWEFDQFVLSIIVDGKEILDIIYKTPYQNAIIEIGETYQSELEINELIEVHIGLHSFAKLTDAINNGDGVYVKCIIPKGSHYFIGDFFDSISYASDKITYLEIVS